MKAFRVALRLIVASVFLVGLLVVISATSYRALTCKFGDYQFVLPSEPGQGEGAYITRKGRMFLLVNEKETDLLDDSGKRFLFAMTRAKPERVGTISYSAYDSAKGEWIENVDLGADGTLDYRTTEVNGRRVKQEFRVGESWLETVQRDGRSGVVFNGRFMSVADAIKLANSTEHK
jgi:hypothetical protein